MAAKGRGGARAQAVVKALYNAARRQRYAKLRDAGATPREARNMQGSSREHVDKYARIRKSGGNHLEAHLYALDPTKTREEIREHARDLKSFATEIWQANRADNPKLKLSDVLRGMRKSGRTGDDWEMYVALRKKEGWVSRSDPRSPSVFGPTMDTLKTGKPAPMPDFTYYPPDEEEEEEDWEADEDE